jgi:hypothetical protein
MEISGLDLVLRSWWILRLKEILHLQVRRSSAFLLASSDGGWRRCGEAVVVSVKSKQGAVTFF